MDKGDIMTNCISLYDKMDRLLDEDSFSLSVSLEGEIYEAYNELIRKERWVLKESRKMLELHCRKA